MQIKIPGNFRDQTPEQIQQVFTHITEIAANQPNRTEPISFKDVWGEMLPVEDSWEFSTPLEQINVGRWSEQLVPTEQAIEQNNTPASAYDKINVRRLVLALRKELANYVSAELIEFNDESTRKKFRDVLDAYLTSVVERNQICDFRVVCDKSNNTDVNIDRNEFVADIYIKPNRTINYIQLNFVAVRSGVSFDEVVGQF